MGDQEQLYGKSFTLREEQLLLSFGTNGNDST